MSYGITQTLRANISHTEHIIILKVDCNCMLQIQEETHIYSTSKS